MEYSNGSPGNDDPPDSFLTLAGPGDAELKVQRSRFLAFAHPVRTEPEIQGRLSEAARRFHDSRHICFGCRLGVGPDATSRRSDDGEPSGTAGKPILTAIGKRELTDVLVIVVRYFGGVKLGTGGLARAYGKAAEMAIDRAGLKEVHLGRDFRVRFPYALEKSIRRLLESRAGRILDQQYDDAVVWRIRLAHSQWRGFAAALKDLTRGSVELQDPED